MSIIVTLIVGGIVGWLAAQILGRREGLFGSIVIGIVGSFIGSFVSQLFTGSDRSYLAFAWSGFIWSLVGALILVAILNVVTKQRHGTA